MWNWDGGWGWWGGLHLLWWLLVLGTVALVFRLGPRRRDTDAGRTDRALAILRERYARGEIDEREYAQRLQVLTGPRAAREEIPAP
jgi:putative membrane protein